jgi:hypothetical protein
MLREDETWVKNNSVITLGDLFRFRGLLGKGAYGIVIVVQDKIAEMV